MMKQRNSYRNTRMAGFENTFAFGDGVNEMDYISIAEAAQKWNISRRRVQVLCAQDRIPGLTKFGKSWAIPKEAEKPADGRKARKKPLV